VKKLTLSEASHRTESDQQLAIKLVALDHDKTISSNAIEKSEF